MIGREQTRARRPDRVGFVTADRTRIGYEVFGAGDPPILLLPTWTIIHARFWKAQIPYLARRHRVVAFDGAGNGRSDRTLDPAAYTIEAGAEAALAVMDETEIERAVLVSLSKGARLALWLAAHRPERVLGSLFVAPSLPLGERDPDRAAAFAAFDRPYTSTEGWAKYNRHYWLDHYEDFLWFFFGKCFTEPHSTKQTEDCVGWARETTPELLGVESGLPSPSAETYLEWCARVRCPTLVIHGAEDEVAPIRLGARLAEATGGTLAVMEGSGHIPLARDPIRVNLLAREFLESLT